MFGCTHNVGRDVIQGVLVSDIPFLLTQVARYINFADTGRAKKNNFALRQEQVDGLDKAYNFFSDPTNIGREFLLDAKMRYGKTVWFYELVMALDARLTLILTGRPSDTKQAWIKEMDHVDFDFDESNFIDASDPKYRTTPIVPNLNRRTIIFASLQDFARLDEHGNLKDKFEYFSGLHFDLLGKDEMHLAFDTSKTREAIGKLNYDHAVNLSGTPFRARLEGRFEEDATFTWSYIDEQRARTEEIATLGVDVAKQDGQYYWLSPMKVFTILLSAELYDESDQFTDDEGFNFAKMFAVEIHNGRPIFRNDTAVDSWLHALSHGTVMPYSKQAHNAHQYAAINLKHTLWYLPGVDACRLMKEKLKKHPIFKDYDIVMAADDNDGEGRDTAKLVKDRIAVIETGGNYKKFKGTITLSCGKLSHGISIPEWGAVFNLSDMVSAQLYFQLSFRCQTPWEQNKYQCYVFDFKPNRTLQCFYDLAKSMALANVPVPTLKKLLNVFNVLSYEGSAFKQVDASDLLSKLEEGFGRSTSLTGLQNLLSELPFEMDAELGEELDDIEDGSSHKNTKGTVVSSNPDAPNGKTSDHSGDGNNDNAGDDDNKDDGKKDNTSTSEEQQKLRIKIAMKAVPLYFFLIQARDFNGLIDSLTQDAGACKAITGMPARSVKKILSSQSVEKQQSITEGLVRFRNLESKDSSRVSRYRGI